MAPGAKKKREGKPIPKRKLRGEKKPLTHPCTFLYVPMERGGGGRVLGDRRGGGKKRPASIMVTLIAWPSPSPTGKKKKKGRKRKKKKTPKGGGGEG